MRNRWCRARRAARGCAPRGWRGSAGPARWTARPGTAASGRARGPSRCQGGGVGRRTGSDDAVRGAREVELFEQLRGAARASGREAVEAALEDQLLGDGAVRAGAAALADVADPAADGGGVGARSWPATVAVPAVGVSSVVSIRSVVVLPAPLGPRKPTSSPGPTSRSTPRTASTDPRRVRNMRASPRAWITRPTVVPHPTVTERVPPGKSPRPARPCRTWPGTGSRRCRASGLRDPRRR